MLSLRTKFSVNLSLYRKFYIRRVIVLSVYQNSGFALPGAVPFANQLFLLKKDSTTRAPEAKEESRCEAQPRRAGARGRAPVTARLSRW